MLGCLEPPVLVLVDPGTYATLLPTLRRVGLQLVLGRIVPRSGFSVYLVSGWFGKNSNSYLKENSQLLSIFVNFRNLSPTKEHTSHHRTFFIKANTLCWTLKTIFHLFTIHHLLDSLISIRKLFLAFNKSLVSY